MSKPEAARTIPETCNDCGWSDLCPVEGQCTRAVLASLGFDTGLPPTDYSDARQIIRDARTDAGDTAIVTVDSAGAYERPELYAASAIIEPPTKAELEGAPRRELYAPGPFQFPASVRVVRPFSRAQIRAAIDEISKAQLQIAPAFEADEHLGAGPETIARIGLQMRTAANVLEALPEAVAHQFGLTIRGACSFCSTTIFNDDPKATDTEGRDVCEAHA